MDIIRDENGFHCYVKIKGGYRKCAQRFCDNVSEEEMLKRLKKDVEHARKYGIFLKDIDKTDGSK